MPRKPKTPDAIIPSVRVAVDAPVNSENVFYLSANNAALYLDVSPSTLSHWRGKNTGPPYISAGRKRYYRSDDLKVFYTIYTKLLRDEERRFRSVQRQPQRYQRR